MPSIRLAAILSVAIVLMISGCGQRSDADPVPAERSPEATPAAAESPANPPVDRVEVAAERAELVLAGGCFWCMEVAFEQLRGVSEVVSGYAGGTADTADYQTVSSGTTRHAEAIRITYDPSVIDEETLLRVFFTAAHDPTQINRQFPDVGRQYRSAIFYRSDEQKQRAAKLIEQLNESGVFSKKIATTLEPLDGFYVAEDYHQDYVKHHPREPYVVAYSLPKAAKVRKQFPTLIRKD